MGLSLEAKPNLKKAHMHMALTAASLSILTHILSLIFISKAKKEDAAPAA